MGVEIGMFHQAAQGAHGMGIESLQSAEAGEDVGAGIAYERPMHVEEQIGQALIHRNQRAAARYLRSELMPLEARPPAPTSTRTELDALTELREPLATISDDDVEFLLQMARKLAEQNH